MRIAFRHLLRTQTLLKTHSTPPQCCLHYPYRQFYCLGYTTTCPTVRFVHTQGFLSSRHSKEATVQTSQTTQNDSRRTRSKLNAKAKDSRAAEDTKSIPQSVQDILRASDDSRRDPTAWVALLDKYIPHDLGGRGSRRNPAQASDPAAVCSDILRILDGAKKQANVGSDILAHMITHSRRKAALWVCDLLLKNLSSRFDRRPLNLPPSNVLWPAGSLDRITGRSIDCRALTHTNIENCDEWETQERDPRYAFVMSDIKENTMDQIWYTLGMVVAQSANMAEVEAQKAMNAVHLVLGQIHNSDLVPENVYDYHLTPFTTTVQRPPIVHLVSSRILTALSDAAWREHQDEVIEKAASHGTSYEEIGRDPPGGRFRLKVSPMGPQIWLEFILWCCVEGGFVAAGSRIIDFLRQDTRDPWFAVAWSTRQGTAFTLPQIDWDRVNSRSGGTVGRIEGYSREKPLAEVPPKTISTEVLLALVEAHLNVVRREDGDRGMLHGLVQKNIADLVAFLEPHDLPLSYFDYVAARLLTTDSFDGKQRGSRMKTWVERLSSMKSLRPIRNVHLPRASFRTEDLAVHSEFGAGLMHQVLDAYISDGNIHEALTTFDGLQQLVDNSKLHAISAFLQDASSSRDAFFSSRPFGGSLDFVESHGQLPLYRLAGLLNLATDANLIGFGQWLLYNEDPDGPLISRSSYGSSSVARALVRFAGMSGDEKLLRAIPSLGSSSQRRPTVNFLRARFDASVSLMDFQSAADIMRHLGRAEAGGFGLTNLAHLAGTILKLETNAFRTTSSENERRLPQATFLLNSMLSGQSGGRHGVLQRSVRAVFRQQIGHILKIFQFVSDSSIASLAVKYAKQFPVSNIPNLSPAIFNVLLEAVIQAKHASRGMELVEKFCTDGSEQFSAASPVLPGDYVDGEEEDSNDEWQSSDVADVGRSSTPHTSSQAPIPFVNDTELSSSQQEVPHEISKATPAPDYHDNASTEESGQEIETLDDFSSPYFTEVQDYPSPDEERATQISTSADSVYNPVCVTDPRTIRLVARAAMREKKQRESDRQSAVRQYEVLTWAKGKFTQLGFPLFMIMNEIKEPLAEAGVAAMKPQKGTRSPQRGVRRFKPNESSRVTSAFGGRLKDGNRG